ncbi:MAG TPA: 23S rRNA (uracil(1939)-C(5))-methyltransferase RlmD [Saprospiraceae bacterium]|nr:23S rRNA (uracil(1939)-C(5))-methyltransferase RlmD [Saprospiraceae bacterium]
MPPKRKLFEDVLIVDTGHKGMSIGKTQDGRVVMVEGVIPGDRVDASAGRKRKGMYQCKPERFIEYSAHRVDPFCSHFGTCGGCKWQHMKYDAQLEFTEKSVLDALKRIAHIPDPPMQPIIGCTEPIHYRNKMEYTFTDRRWLTEEELDGNVFDETPVAGSFDETPLLRNGLGLHVAGAFAHVVNITTCFLQPEPANAIRNFVRDFAIEHQMSFQIVKYHKGFLRNLVLRNNSSGQFMVTLVFGEEDPGMRDKLLKAMTKKFDCISSLYFCINTKLNDSTFDLDFTLVAGSPYLPMQLGHIEYHLGPKSFFQTNSRQAETMCRVVQQMAGLSGNELVYDLYSGIGSFALYMAKDARQIVGIEEIREAVDDAKLNALHNQISNVHFFAGDVRKLILLPEVHQFGKPDVIITDPPRAGMEASVVESLLYLGAPKIVYVSCNPATQARDIELLSSRYHLINAQPIDMFPQTAHVENVALLIHG